MIKNNRPLLALFAAAAACGQAQSAPAGLQGVLELHQRQLGFEQAGRLLVRPVQRGQRVQQGQMLAALDDGLEKPLREARAQDAQAAQAQYELLLAGTRKEDVRATQAQLRGAHAAEDDAARALARARTLRAENTVPQAQLDGAQAQAERARAEREALEERLAGQQKGARAAELRQAHARVLSARAALAQQDARLERLTLRAPIDGVILDTTAEPGEVLAAGTPVVVLGEPQRPYLDVFVPQQSLAGLVVSAKMLVRVDSASAPFRGAVEDIARTTEFTPRYLFSPRERVNLVVRVRIAVEDPDGLLHAGVPAFATLQAPAP